MKSAVRPLSFQGPAREQSVALVFLAGAIIGVLGGMIGLGGAEFRLPLLIGVFGFAALQAIIMNKAMSLIVVITALPARLFAIPIGDLSPYWFIVLNLLAGSLIGAWIGAHWATRLKSKTLYRVIGALLALIAALLFCTHFFAVDPLTVADAPRIIAGVAAGVIIGVVAALMGVAGGELLIPTIVLLFGTDIKIAGSLSLAVSLPTMLVAFARFSRDKSFSVLGQNKRFLVTMTLGSITGTIIGGLLLGVIPSLVLLPLLVALLLLSSVKVWNHDSRTQAYFCGSFTSTPVV
ncbi:sulfite exporter TauE/SafE family protein [Paenarthrobacter nitroguajacolicus]|uniref:Probable membrane transporter protein n=1 Tax=Paenarthrobacter nitroguajacolicus TaxID=211146 RepID=A0A558GYS5_PAENT|nr:sulfite exporter TauE/SafE family protein [Paenarthrobacter nitroguajacolicus]TVU62009.1 sulfite exporter TauE/SafE family protein [Paenarthrobacter nitroguajacolicus]